MANRTLLHWLTAGLALAGVAGALPRVWAQDAPAGVFDFEKDTQGFTPILVKDADFGVDPAGGVSVTRAKDQVKSGDGTLVWGYRPEAGQMRALSTETRLPAGAQRVEMWVKCTVQSSFVMIARETDGSGYQLAFHVPPHEWTKVGANLDELTLDENGKDENGKLDVDQVAHIQFLDVAALLASFPGLSNQADILAPRQVWLDDLRFADDRTTRSSGAIKEAGVDAHVIDNFEADVIRWVPIRVTLAEPPAFQIFAADTSLKLLKEAAGPGMARTAVEAGRRGLRFTYTRSAKDLFGVVTDFPTANLSRADRLRLSFHISRKSLLLITLKEKDGSEYNHTILPEASEGWQSLDLPLSGFALGDDSKDENNSLDPGQIKEIGVIDASGVLGEAVAHGETSLDLDAVSFNLK